MTVIPTHTATAAAQTCESLTATVVGTEGPDTLVGSPDRDVIVGLGGDDDISGLGGDDVICGGAGDDVLRGGDGDDRLSGQDGDDVLAGGPGGDTGAGGAGENLCQQLTQHSGCRAVPDRGLRATGPERTASPSAVVRGFAPVGAIVRVFGGLAPVSAEADADGVFRVVAVIRPGKSSELEARIRVGTQVLTHEVTIRQEGVSGSETVRGRVVNPDGEPVSGARVAYDAKSVVSGADGTYTLSGLPAGLVSFRATRAGFLGGLVTVETTGDAQADIMIQPLAAPVTVGPQGGAFEGMGYRVVVPAGAVTALTSMNITPLVMSGDKDAFGLPIVDLSPSGLRFRTPITVDLDPGVVDVAAADAEVTGLNPDTGEVWPLPSTVVDGRLRVTLRELNGMELRLPFEPEALGKECTPYNPVVAYKVREFYQATLPPFLLANMGLDSAILWGIYLQGGKPSTRRYTLTGGGLNAFKNHPKTVAERRKAVDGLEGALLGTAGVPVLRPPATPAVRQVRDFGVGQGLEINYSDPYSVPGNLAGGISESSEALGSVKDTREIDGPVRFVPSATGRGVLTQVKAEADLTFTVKDSVDLCPGGIGAHDEQYATIGLSRLEKTGIPLIGGTFTMPLFFIADPDLGSETFDVTRRYPTNDPDHDAVPDRQPWEGGTFTLDNCPAAANADQADLDGDRVGDVCDEDDEQPSPGTGSPASAGSFGDPHLFTFDGVAYDFQATGDYVVAEDVTDGFQIQARYARNSDGPTTVSYNRGAAAKVGGSVIAFGDDAATAYITPMAATLDGVPLTVTATPTDLPGGATVRLDGIEQVVRWPDGTELRVGTESAFGQIYIRLAQAREGKVRGLFGDADGDRRDDLAARDGTLVENPRDPAQIYGSFGTSWRVEGEESLFRTPLPDLIGLPVLPTSVPSIAQLSTQARVAAEEACRARDLESGAGLEQCVLDVGLTGDTAFADAAAGQADRLRDSVDASAINPEAQTTTPITLGDRVGGTLRAPFAVDVFTVELTEGDGVSIGDVLCLAVGTFAVTLVSPSGEPLGRSGGEGCGSLKVTDLPESGTYELRVQDVGGFTGDYAFYVRVADLGISCQANQVAPNDDSSSAEIDMPFPIEFYGRDFSSVWVNNNGNVTFDGPLADYTSGPLRDVRRAMAAAWWADVDTRGSGKGQVRYGLGEVGGRQAFCVDFEEVAYFGSSDDKRNSFELYIVDRGDVGEGAFDIVYRYQKLQWETGNASGGVDGLGGTSATVGYSNGTGTSETYEELDGSRDNGVFLDGGEASLVTSSSGNTDEPGVHIFSIH
ncbi:hypothetical protein HerbRD11066_17580 [Herbidospora sp. RD11066]